MTIVKVIKALYVKLGGSLTDTYSGIAGGAPVSSYSVISDCIKALYVLYGGDLSEVYPAISDVAVKDYTTSAKAIAALAKVISKGVMVDESYDISEGTLNSATVTLEGDVTANIPDGVSTISPGAFCDNSIITKIIMPNSVTTILNGMPQTGALGAFYNCINLKDIIFSNSLTSIGNKTFYQCKNITNITLPNSVESIGDSSFYNCINLKNIILSNNLTSIGREAFVGCYALEALTIPNSVTNIGNRAFDNCKALTTLTIPNSITSISSDMCTECTSLTTVVIPKSITVIGDSAFDRTNLTDIYYTGTQAEWEQITIGADAIPEGATIHYEYTPE